MMGSDHIQPCLREVELFERVPDHELDALNTMLPLTSYQAGQIIYDPLRPVQTLFIVKTGRVRVFHTSPSGKTFTLAVYEPGDVFGSMPLVGQDMGASFAEALDDVSVCQLGIDHVKEFLLSDPRIAQQIAVILGRRVMELEGRLSDLALRPLTQRVASLVLSTSKPSALPWKHERIVRLTHEQLASLAGASREGVSKAVAELAQQGFIVQKRGSIVVLDPRGLAVFKDSSYE